LWVKFYTLFIAKESKTSGIKKHKGRVLPWFSKILFIPDSSHKSSAVSYQDTGGTG
jgi:hypothetical protein